MKMKNLKVKFKLTLSFALAFLLTILICFSSIIAMQQIQKQTSMVAKEMLSNTNCIWQIRRNLLSAQRYMLMAFAEEDMSSIQNYLDSAQKDLQGNKSLIEQCAEYGLLNESQTKTLEACFPQASSCRKELVQLLSTGSEPDAVRAFQIFKNQYLPLHEQQATIFRELNENQLQLSRDAAQRSHELYQGALTSIIVILALVLIADAFIVLRLSRAILNPLNQIHAATSALADGDFSKELFYDSQDEFGETCESIQKSFTELKRIIASITGNFNKMADGDFTFDGQTNFPGEMAEIEHSGCVLLNKLNTFLHEIKSSADQIRAGSDQVASGAQALAQGATEQASSIQELSASLSDISTNVQTNAENSKKANELAITSGEVAQSTQQDMQDMLTAMGKISMSSESIRKVIKVIDDITFQTNILSLNAAVEAARAGVAGKGFAVVADEVRNLAQKSSESAKEITALIESTIEAVDQGEKIAQTTSEAFNELTSKIQDVVSTVNEIAAASQEQSETIQQITIGVDQISAVVQTNSATSEESAAASEELSSQANMLNDLVGQFKLRSERDMLLRTAPEDDKMPSPVSNLPLSSPFDKY